MVGTAHQDHVAVRRPELDAPALAGAAPELRAKLDELCSMLWAAVPGLDDASTLPAGHLDALADAGLYGIFAPASLGGLELEFPQVCAVVEELASSCLATTLVWVQHLRFLSAVLDPLVPEDLRSAWTAPAIAGRAKAGIALTGLMPGPVRLTASRARGGWTFDGVAPWVSGWDMVDVLVVVGRHGANVVTALLDARPQNGLTISPTHLSAINASRTVRLDFDGVFAGDDRVMGVEPYVEAYRSSERLRLNGSFSLGVAKRCCTFLGPTPLDGQLRRSREQLDTVDEAGMPAARAVACDLAVRAAHALSVSRGSSAALAGDLAERLSREAALLLVFASRPPIKETLLRAFETPPAP
jgi:alkylation response protein AidB-like acyl-CoA dehydrogenase